MITAPSKTAALKILYDNGMVNRFMSEDVALSEAWSRITKRVTTPQIEEVTQWLATLSDDQLDDVCCGEQHTDIPPLVDTVLNLVFEETA